jgi:hypothetical protein
MVRRRLLLMCRIRVLLLLALIGCLQPSQVSVWHYCYCMVETAVNPVSVVFLQPQPHFKLLIAGTGCLPGAAVARGLQQHWSNSTISNSQPGYL